MASPLKELQPLYIGHMDQAIMLPAAVDISLERAAARVQKINHVKLVK